MSLQGSVDSSDDESCVFSGPITLKEVKKRLGIKVQRPTKSHGTILPKENCDSDLRKVEANVELPSHTKLIEQATKSVDDSVLNIKNQDSTRSEDVEEIGHSLAAVELIARQYTSEQEEEKNLVPISKLINIESTDNTEQNSITLYQHVESPIAANIKQSPQVPLVKDVLPKKPLRSLIPRIKKPKEAVSLIPSIKKPKEAVSSKENIHLPHVAHQSAKSIKVIGGSASNKLPQSNNKAKQAPMAAPLVIKQQHRENQFTK